MISGNIDDLLLYHDRGRIVELGQKDGFGCILLDLSFQLTKREFFFLSGCEDNFSNHNRSEAAFQTLLTDINQLKWDVRSEA